MKNKFSLFALCFCYGIMIYTGFFFYPKWNKGGSEATISWDASGYYMYLPALFIYHDLRECKFQKEIGDKYSPTPNFENARLYNHTSGRIMQYNCGQAIAMAPFFLVGHSYAMVSAIYSADGFSFPYQLAIGLGMFLYSMVGLFFLRKILLYYFPDKVVGYLLLFYISATVLLNYLSIDQAQANCCLFAFYSILIYSTIQFYKNPSRNRFLFIAFLCGLMTLIRPTDIICLLIPLFWGIYNWQDMQIRFQFWLRRKEWIVLASIAFVVIPSLQFFYWYYVLGEWFAYSYRDQGFSWLHPHVFQVLFSFKSGFLTYSPGMILAYLSLISYMRSIKFMPVIFLLIFISHYITCAWDITDYGWYSGRAFIQYFPILAFPLASLIHILLERKWTSVLFFLLWSGSIYFNIWWSYHIHFGNIAAMNLTKTEYWQNIGRWR